jgi:hypothetical protein
MIGPIAFMLSLSTTIKILNVFHVSLQKYVHDPHHVIDWDLIQVQPEADFQVQPMCIFNKKVTMLKYRAYRLVKVQ